MVTGSRPVDQVRQESLRFIERARPLSVAISASERPSGEGGRRMGTQYDPEPPFDAGTRTRRPRRCWPECGRPRGTSPRAGPRSVSVSGPSRRPGLNRARSRKPAGRHPRPALPFS